MPNRTDPAESTVDEKQCNNEFSLFFVYGSLLSARYLRKYTPSAGFVMKADLANYEIQFRQYSEKRQGGTSCIIEAPGQMVHGVLYRIAKQEIRGLDVLEGVPEGRYKRETFLVLGEDREWYSADLYRLIHPTGPYTPSKSYLDDMIEGAKAHGLEHTYVEKLVSWRSSLD
jgi:gamma-glutamylcyclotransferase (GGCT)/AIG2-like uncharacterized protein YtfP